jgi:hypothetical protein
MTVPPISGLEHALKQSLTPGGVQCCQMGLVPATPYLGPITATLKNGCYIRSVMSITKCGLLADLFQFKIYITAVVFFLVIVSVQ